MPSLEELLAVVKKPCQTERLLPTALHHMLHAVFQLILEQPASVERNLLLLVLPKLIWNSSFRAAGSMRGHKRRLCIEKRFLTALKGDWQRQLRG